MEVVTEDADVGTVPLPGAICWAFPGTPALPSPSSLHAPRAGPHICPVWCPALRHAPGPLVLSPQCDREEASSLPTAELWGGPTQRSKRPETPCEEQVSLLLQFLTCSSVRAAGGGEHSDSGIHITSVCQVSGAQGGAGHAPGIQSRETSRVPWGCCRPQPPAPLSGSGPSFLISTEETLLLPLQEPLIGPFS